jgi:serine/threonine protein kinase
MAKYCCFNCPEATHDDKRELDQKCPTCGFAYGFPLQDAPKKVGKYEIIEAISRGFYGAVYRVVDPILGKDYVLKLIPKSIYTLHKKDFYLECKDHADLAKGSQHIVNIMGAEESDVLFSNDQTVACYVAVLDYVPGKVLKEILANNEGVNSIKIAQIAIDLFRILDVLRAKQKNHNDLHSENIIVQDLSYEERRPNETDDRIRVVAIDIGSLTSENKAGDSPGREGDVHWVAKYLIALSEKLLKNNDRTTDQDYRLASLLEDRAKLMFPAYENQRAPNFDEIIESITNCFKQQAYPWEEPLKLLNFNDTYNAQTLDPWFIPSLLVDPDDQWLNMISGKGPLIITGMRGCGKTMMLKALQFHARAAAARYQQKDNKEAQIARLKNEVYVGIYVSCNKLLDEIGKAATAPLHQPFSRLFIRYGIEAIKAARHLQSISDKLLNNNYYQIFLNVYKEHLKDGDLLNDVINEGQLEQCLLRMIYSLNKGEDKYVIQANPANAFPALAQAIRSCSSMWANHYILFLLDDVSTRYLGDENIQNLLSSLLFQSEDCAFKITSEVQTIELVLQSPGKVERAKKGRDYDSFDLGSAVNQKIRNKGGKKFVADILNRRAKGNVKHPAKEPIEIVGDTTLHSIAQAIVTRGDDKTLKKRIYYGLSALAGVCVGDIGDIINLYDLIVRRYDYDKHITPIPAELQNECFQDLCSIRLHEVNRRGHTYKDFAMSFAQASHELLVKSSKDKSSRLRQYYSIYVRITTGDLEKQYEKIRSLLDAGIFVYSGGANTPRTLGNDNNPINQFKLTYRKLYGLSYLIGLTQGDRFELSGKDLEDWLSDPALGKEVLIKNAGGAGSNVDEGDELDEAYADIKPASNKEIESHGEYKQGLLFNEPFVDSEALYYQKEEIVKLVKDKTPLSTKVTYDLLQEQSFDVAIAALGFEDRAIESIKNLLKLKINKLLLVRYEEEGKTNEILKLVKESGIIYEVIPFEQVKTSFDSPAGNIICDITGMSKSLIFNTVRNGLKNSNQIFISHFKAATYYPLEEEIQAEMDKLSEEDNYNKLEIITDKVIKGEKGPYEVYDLLFSDTDESKRTVLLGFTNSKYERLFKLLEDRSFDRIQIFRPEEDNTRNKLAELASEIITKSNPTSESNLSDPDDLERTLLTLTKEYQRFYIDQNYNFEIALTGSKSQTVACAAISASFKVSHCWYVKPGKWDTASFSQGIGDSVFYKLELK